MRRSIYVARQPWTSDLSETFQTRILEKYIQENFSDLDIKYVGRDFPLEIESNYKKSLIRSLFFTGNLTNDALRFLELQPQISTLAGVHLGQSLGPVRGRLGLRQLFLSETFRREFSQYRIGTQDFKSQYFLESFGIECSQIGFVSILLGTLSKSFDPSKNSTQILLLDVSKNISDAVAKSTSGVQKIEVINTKISELYGETKKNAIIESLFCGISASELLVTTNPIYATGALSLGKKVIHISNTKDVYQGFSSFSDDEFMDHLRKSNLFDLTFSLTLEEIHEKQLTVTKFLKSSFQDPMDANLALDAAAYRNQVIAEVINSILESEGKFQARNSELEARNSELEARNSELEARNSELEARNSELEARNSELEINSTSAAELYLDFHALEDQIHHLTNSRSWRATEPLRRVHGFIRRLTDKD
jgi:hypothetical protein